MTCIVGYARDGRVWMGGDSAGVGGYSLTQRADEKVFRNGDYLFGFTSSFRMGQLLRYRLEPPRRHPADEIVKFMATEFVDAVRKCLKEYAFSTTKDGVEEGGEFLVGVEGALFKIEGDYQVGRSLHPFNACGCGEDIALGVMHSLHRRETDAEQLLREALTAAETFSAGVRGPFNIISSPPQRADVAEGVA